MIEFNEIKKTVLNLISKSNFEITSQTNEEKSGIYMIYVNNFTNEKIIPIYVGKSSNIQQRYEQHYNEILALNHLSYNRYEEYFYSKGFNFYDGKFKTCKIFKFMLENNCSLNDYKMIVLEYCEQEELEKNEQKYIKLLKSEYFGFNQFNVRTLYPIFAYAVQTNNKEQIISYLDKVIENCIEIPKYLDFGYTTFNYDYTMHKLLGFNCEFEDIDIINKIKETNEHIKNIREKIPFKIEYELRKKLVDEAIEIRNLKSTIRDTQLLELKKQSSDLEQKLIKLAKNLIKPSSIYNEKWSTFAEGLTDIKRKNNFNEYLKKKNILIDIYSALDDEIKTYKEIVEKINVLKEIENNKNLELDKRYQSIIEEIIKQRKIIFQDIFPLKKYNRFCLKDNIINNNQRTGNVFVLLSNNARSKIPSIVRIDVCDNGNYENFYIKSQLTTKICKGIDYVEKNFEFRNSFQAPQPFNVIPKNSYIHYSDFDSYVNPVEYITLKTEYKYGVNDYTIKNSQLSDIEEIIEYIKNKLGDNISISCSESKNTLKKALEEFENISKVISFFKNLK